MEEVIFECDLGRWVGLQQGTTEATQGWDCCCCSVAQSRPTLCDPRTAAPQASQTLTFTISRSLFKLMSIESVMPSNHLSSLSLLAFNLSKDQGLFQWVSSSHQVAKELELQLQYFRMGWLGANGLAKEENQQVDGWRVKSLMTPTDRPSEYNLKAVDTLES